MSDINIYVYASPYQQTILIYYLQNQSFYWDITFKMNNCFNLLVNLKVIVLNQFIDCGSDVTDEVRSLTALTQLTIHVLTL